MKLQALVEEFNRDGFVLLRKLFPEKILVSWREAFAPLLKQQMEIEGGLTSRGAHRYYVTLPFEKPFADPAIFENDLVLELCEKLVGPDMVLCQLATDTPVLGSAYQDLHRDAPPLFPEWGEETPSFQLAVNFPLVNVGPENGPFEVVRGTHRMSKEEAARRVEAGEARLEPVHMDLGDVLIRDVRAAHRGTPNRTREPRPMAVLGYSRRWLFRPEVSIEIPESEWAKLSEGARRLLRFNPRVESLSRVAAPEAYQVFSY